MLVLVVVDPKPRTKDDDEDDYEERRGSHRIFLVLGLLVAERSENDDEDEDDYGKRHGNCLIVLVVVVVLGQPVGEEWRTRRRIEQGAKVRTIGQTKPSGRYDDRRQFLRCRK